MKHINLIKNSKTANRTVQEEKQINKRIGISFALYLFFFGINVMTGIFMNCITLDEEFLPATAAAAILGKDWSAVMPQFSSVGQLANGILYLPAMLLFPNPVVQYKFYMIISSAVYALVAPCSYILATRLGITEIWQRIVTASVCTLAPVIISGSHFIATDSLCAVIVWLLAMIILKDDTAEDKKSARRFLLATVAGILCAMAYFINPAMIILPFIITGFCIFLYFSHKRRPLFLAVFIIAFAVLFAADLFLSKLISEFTDISFGGGIISLTAASFSTLVSRPSEFFAMLGGKIYTFTVSSWGLASGAVAFMLIGATSYYRRKRKNKEQFYSENYALCSIFFLLTLLIIPVSALFSLGGDVGGQESYLSASGLSAIITAFIFMFFIYIFRYGITYVRLMSVIAVTGILSFTGIMLCEGCVTALDSFDSVTAAGISPLKLDFLANTPFDSDSMVYPVFFIFTALAALIPVVCCAKKYAHRITAFVCTGLILFSAIYTYIDTVFVYSAKGSETAVALEDISGYVAKTGENAPVIAVCGKNDNLAKGIQYFNQGNEVIYTDNKQNIPESCYLIMQGNDTPYGYCVLIGRTDDINIYAYGKQTVLWNEGNSHISES